MDPVSKDLVEERMVRHGLVDIPISSLNKNKAVNDLLVAEVVITRTLALESFYKGLNCLGLGDLMRKYPVITRVVFPSLADSVIDPEMLLNRLEELKKKNRIEVSGEKEEQAWQWFTQFIRQEGSCKGKRLRSSQFWNVLLKRVKRPYIEKYKKSYIYRFVLRQIYISLMQYVIQFNWLSTTI